MDGRVQLPVIKYLQKRFNADYVDTITEAGPNLILAEQKESGSIESIFVRLKISIENHNSIGIAISGHHGGAVNASPKNEQIEHTKDAVNFLKKKYSNIEIIGLWVDENWEVSEINT